MKRRIKQRRSRRDGDRGRDLRRGRDDPPRIRVRDPEDFVAVVPYLLGFHPTESVVVVFFDGGRVALTARMDLPGVPGAPPTFGLLAAQIADLAEQVRASSVVLLCYSASPVRRMDFDLFVHDARFTTIEALQVSPERWWSLLCTTPECCPPEGTPYDLSGHPLCAEAVLAGMGAVSDRAAVAAFVTGPPEDDLVRLEESSRQAIRDLDGLDRTDRKLRMRRLVERSLRDPTAVPDEECVELAALCLDLEVRDVAWALMTRADASTHLALWRRVVSRTVDRLTAGPLGLESLAAWISGNGALLNCGIARLESVHPEYGLLSLLSDVSQRALPPSAWDTLGPAIREELDELVPS